MKDVIEEIQLFTGLEIHKLIGEDNTDPEEPNHPYGQKYLKLKDVLTILYKLNIKMEKDFNDCQCGEYTKSWIQSNLHELIELLQKVEDSK